MENLLQVRSFGVNFYVLRDERGLILLDAGFLGGRRQLRRALFAQGWERERIYGIVVTHGHLDHILNVGKLAQETGAWIAAPATDALYYEGRTHYQGLSRVTGVLESLGRRVLPFQQFTPDRLLAEGDFLDIWHGLEVVSLPGHTAGHCGFYCAEKKLLFSADLFASYQRFSHFPPRVFNADQSQIRSSVQRALELDFQGVLPNHGDRVSPEKHGARLRKLAQWSFGMT